MAPPSRSGPHPWRALAGLAVIVLVMLFSVLGPSTFHPGKWHTRFKVGLGLDLSSGTQVTLRAATANGKAPQSGEIQQAVNVLESRVNGTGVSGAQVQPVGSDLINVSLPGKGAQQTIDLISTTAQLRVRPVLLYQPYSGSSASGSSATPSATPRASGSPSASPAATSSAKASSSAAAGVRASPSASATAAKAGTQAMSAQRAAAAASPTASSQATASASPRASPSTSPRASASASPSPSATSSSASPTYYGSAAKVNAATMKLFNKLVCKPGPNANTVNDSWKATVGYSDARAQYDDVHGQIVSCDASGNKYVLDKAVFQGKDITSVSAGIAQNTTQWVVDLSLNGAATKAFGTVTTNQYNNYYSGYQSGSIDDQYLDSTAVVLDGDAQSVEVTSQPITAGQVEIQGPQPTGFTQTQATQLSNILKYGALPLSFTQQSVSSISAQTGSDSLYAGLIAGIIGLGLVVIYLFCYYRGLGIVSVCSLLTAALLAYLGVVLLSLYEGFTMELSGIAGLVVAIGITADSFIVFFERLRDEVRDGKTLRPAVESGWRRARRTILVSDTVSFLAAVLLYHFAVSDVQGFAFTLGLTTLIDVLVVFMFTKPMVTLLANTKFFGGGHRWSGLDPARLGARAPWRSSARRTVRTQRVRPSARSGSPASSATSREA